MEHVKGYIGYTADYSEEVLFAVYPDGSVKVSKARKPLPSFWDKRRKWEDSTLTAEEVRKAYEFIGNYPVKE